MLFRSKVNLESRRWTYILLGLVAVLSVVYVAFEWNNAGRKDSAMAWANVDVPAEDMIVNTFNDDVPPPPPEKPEISGLEPEINAVDDDADAGSLDINSEDDANKVQDIIGKPIKMEPIDDGEDDPDYVFVRVEEAASFPGGDKELMKYLSNNVRYPIRALENDVQGRVIVQFTVRRDGSVADVEVVRTADAMLNDEAVRVIKSMPRWLPGKQRGKAVNCKFTVPVTFKIKQ